MEKLLSLQEMASILGRSAKTFRAHVTSQGIPHIRLGSRLLFDKEEVIAYLKEQPAHKPIKLKGRRRSPRGRFAEVLGL